MSLVLLFYFAGVIGSITMLTLVVACIAAACAGVSTLNAVMDIPPKPVNSKLVKKFITAAIVCGSLTAFLPSKSTIYQMAAAYGVSEVIANPDVQRLAGKSLALVEKTLDGYLKEGK